VGSEAGGPGFRRLVADWDRAMIDEIGAAVARFEEEAHPDRRLRQAMHMIGAGVGRVDRELGLS
jgi:hypothetical protein